MARRSRFLYWMLWWFYRVGFMAVIGGAIAYWTIRSGNLAVGAGVALATFTLVVVAVIARSREFKRGRAVLWKWPNNAALQRQRQAFWKQVADEFVSALPALEHASELSPYDPDAWANLAYVLNRLGRRDEALAASERALALDPDHASAWARKGGALIMLGRTEDGLVAVDHALTLDADDAYAWASRTFALRQLGRFTDVVDASDRALALGIDKSARWDAVMVLGAKVTALAKVGRLADALKACDRLVAIEPNLALSWDLRARCLVALGRNAEAKVALRRARELCR